MDHESNNENRNWLPDKAVLKTWGGRTATLNWWQIYLVLLASVILASSLLGCLVGLAMRSLN